MRIAATATILATIFMIIAVSSTKAILTEDDLFCGTANDRDLAVVTVSVPEEGDSIQFAIEYGVRLSISGGIPALTDPFPLPGEDLEEYFFFKMSEFSDDEVTLRITRIWGGQKKLFVLRDGNISSCELEFDFLGKIFLPFAR